MKRTLLTLMAAGAAVLGGFMMVQRESNERARPYRIKETFWSKVRELWAIRRRCQEIKLQQRGNQPPPSTEFSASFLRRNSREATNLPARSGS
jgi:hypothetical protein